MIIDYKVNDDKIVVKIDVENLDKKTHNCFNELFGGYEFEIFNEVEFLNVLLQRVISVELVRRNIIEPGKRYIVDVIEPKLRFVVGKDINEQNKIMYGLITGLMPE